MDVYGACACAADGHRRQHSLRLERLLDDFALTHKHIKLGMPALCCFGFDWLDHFGSKRIPL